MTAKRKGCNGFCAKPATGNPYIAAGPTRVLSRRARRNIGNGVHLMRLAVSIAMAARLSFLLSIPAILGAVLLQVRKVQPGGADPLLAYAAGTAVAALSGYLALRWLVSLVRRGGLHWFAAYVVPLGVAVLLYSLFT